MKSLSSVILDHPAYCLGQDPPVTWLNSPSRYIGSVVPGGDQNSGLPMSYWQGPGPPFEGSSC